MTLKRKDEIESNQEVVFEYRPTLVGGKDFSKSQSCAFLDSTGWFAFEAIIMGNPPSANRTLRQHHFSIKKTADTWKSTTLGLVGITKRPPRPLENASINVTRYASRMMDFDGLVSSLKWIVDGLVLGGVIIDDSWDVTGPWSIDQRKSSRKDARIEILIVGKTDSRVSQ